MITSCLPCSGSKTKVLVTGASRGIGKHIALRLAQRGFTVYGACRDPWQYKKEDFPFDHIYLDLMNADSIEACFDQIGNIDILINNAGISQLGSVEEVTQEEGNLILQTNFLGAVALTKQAVHHMRMKGHGTIINIGSLVSLFPIPYQSWYVASKAALAGFTRALRLEVRELGIKVCLIEPGDIKTGIEPIQKKSECMEYDLAMNTISRNRRKNMQKAPSPEVVARLVEKIIGKPEPRPVYYAGCEAACAALLKRFLPESITESLIAMAYLK
jgi:short-subunit dehydrogenase